ncbi:hypothetical protein Hanom_Chr15g01400451 [Helianthus anomalus]
MSSEEPWVFNPKVFFSNSDCNDASFNVAIRQHGEKSLPPIYMKNSMIYGSLVSSSSLRSSTVQRITSGLFTFPLVKYMGKPSVAFFPKIALYDRHIPLHFWLNRETTMVLCMCKTVN